MPEFAIAIQENIDLLVDRYDAGLRGWPGYDRLPETLRRDLERHVLNLIAQTVERADYAALVQYVQQRAAQWDAMGLPLPWFQQALVIPEEILTPLIDSVKTSNLLWQALNRSQGIIWQMVADRSHQTEQTMRENEERLNSVFNNMQDAFYRTDAEGCFSWMSPSTAKILGYDSTDDLVGKGVAETIYAVSQEREQFLQVLREKGRVTDYEVTLKRRDGSHFTVSTNSAFYYDSANQVAGVEGVFRDITDRKQAEAQLRESEARYQLLSEATTEGIAIHEKGMVLAVNQVCSTMFGYDLAEFIGMRATDFFVPESREIVANNIRAGYEKPYEVTGLRKDGTTFPLELTGKSAPYQGRLARITVLRDLTERKQAEAQIERSLQETRVRLEVSQALAGQKTEEEVLATLIQQAGLYPQALVTLGTFDKVENDVVAVARYAASFESGMVPNLPMGTRFPFSQFPLFKLMSADRPFVSQDTFAADNMDAATLEITRDIGAAGFAAFPLTADDEWLGYMMVFAKTTGFFDEEKQHLYQTLVEQGAVALRTARLRDQIQASLERRGRQVQLSTEVAQEIAAAQDLNELLRRVVTLIKERFDYYHAQIFRHDPSQDAMVLVTGYGDAGQHMLAARHQLPMGRGVVGTAAATGQSILASDVRQDKDWRPNPYLPDTKGELAVPIKLREEVLGILDVQSDRIGALSEEDRLLLEGLCGQIASAMESTRLLEQLRRSQIELSDALKIAQLANWEYDVLTDTFTFNDRFYDLMHTTAEREGGYTMSSAQYAQRFVHPEDAPIVGREVQAAIETTDPHFSREIDHRIFYADGEMGYIMVRFRIEKDAQGRTIKTFGANQDITGRKQIEDVLRRSEAQLSEALKIAKLGYWEYDVEQDRFLFNDQFYSIFHTTAEQVGGYQISSAQYAQQFVYPDDLPVVGAEIERALNSTDRHYNRQLEHRILYADGGVGHISVSINIDRDEQGHILRYYGANQDITERKQAEQVLRETEERFRIIAETSPIPILISRASDGTVLYGNEHLGETFGISIPDLIGRQTPDFYVDTADRLPLLTQLKRDGILRDYELHVKRADGTPFWVLVSMRPMAFDGQPALLAAFYDITERKLAEQTLAEEHTRLRTLIDNLPVSVFIKDRTSRFLVNNTVHLRILGAHSQEEVLGKWDFDYFTPDLAAQYFADEQELMRIGQPLYDREEFVVDRLTGERRWALSTKIPLRDAQNQVTGFVGFTQDITERKQAEAKLQELLNSVQQSEQLMRTLIDAMPDHIYAKDAQGRLILANAAEARLHDLADPEALVGKSDFDFYPLALAEQYAASEQPILRDGVSVFNLEEPNVDASGHEKWSLTTKIPLRNKQGQITGLVGITRDITERKQAEVERERLLREQERRALQLQTASEVSHAASSILNLDELLPQVAELIRTRFDLYYVGIFLLDELEDRAILRAGTGEAGQQMLSNRHKLKIGGNSMISQCIVTRQARIALDVGAEAVRFDNPLLPLTRSEMALPLISRGRIIGAVTIQSDQPAAFTSDDVAVLQSMADQIGNAVENARLYQQTQTALQEIDAINRRLTGEAWDTYLRQRTDREMIRAADDESAAPEPLLQLDEQLTTGEITIEPDPKDGSEATVTAPILLRGQPIGALRMRTPLREWSEDTEALLAEIADHVAQAVENARLVEQTQRTAQRERMINEINARVRQSVDLDAILRTAVNELGQSLKATRVMARVGTLTAEGAATPSGDGRGKSND